MVNTPCHIIAGPLGVGKTTAILDYLRQNAGSQRVGVLVNDFGPVGLDSTTLQAEAPGTKVLNVPGGCICCTMLAELPGCINRLLAEQDLDRLIIEPSGMAAPSQVTDMLRGAQAELNISLQPTVVMLNAAAFDEETYERMGYYRVFCEAADILVFNRCDQASEAKIERARQWASKLDPPKLRVITTSHGQLPADLFATENPAAQEPECAGHHTHDHDHSHDHSHDHGHDHDPQVHPGGFILDAERRFDQEVLLVNLIRICYQGVEGNEIMRLKGVFHTNSGWQSIEIANQEVSFRPSAHRRDNRMEWLTKPGAVDQERILQEIDRSLNREEIAALLAKG
ncbi:MAG: GTP-binding protein [Planctomycetota bacterium]